MSSLIFDVYYSIGELPKRNFEFSDDVLIDVDGERVEFQIGRYDFLLKKWRLYAPDIQIQPTMCWTYLPLIKYES